MYNALGWIVEAILYPVRTIIDLHLHCVFTVTVHNILFVFEQVSNDLNSCPHSIKMSVVSSCQHSTFLKKCMLNINSLTCVFIMVF